MKIIFTLFIFFFSTSSYVLAQETQIRGFVDTQFGQLSSDTLTDSKKNHGFAVGQFDLFITSQINDRINFLGETVFEWDAEIGDWVVDVERIIIKYAIKDYFNVSAGKFHTVFGYWNNAYHHGAVIQPTINRPIIVRFEDNGGYLPIHQVGLQFSGTAISGKNFGYNLFLSNGQSQGNTGGTFNYNTSAISGNVSLEPIENLQIIASAFTSHVPKNTVTYQGITLTDASRYTLINGALTYLNPSAPIEFIAEYYNISNKMASTTKTNAFFAYLGFPFSRKIIPYVLYNKVNFQNDERYFIKNNTDEITVGVRYSFTPKSVWKLEYTSSNSELYNKASLLQTQFAIGF